VQSDGKTVFIGTELKENTCLRGSKAVALAEPLKYVRRHIIEKKSVIYLSQKLL